jgi:hypothetical protein
MVACHFTDGALWILAGTGFVEGALSRLKFVISCPLFSKHAKN